MKTKLIVALAFGLAMAGSALAEDTTTTGSTVPDKWRGPLSDTFWTDTSGSMRPDNEISMRWTKLSTEQQAMAREECGNTKYKTNPKVGASSDRTGGGGGMTGACDWVNKQ